MSYKDLDRFHDHTTLDGKAWQVMSVICHHANLETGAAWPSQETIATKAKCSTKTVQRAVKAAQDAGELYVIPGNGRGQLTTYIVLVGLSLDEQRERLALNKVDTSCLPLGAGKVDIFQEKGGHLDASKPEKVDISEQKVDILEPKGGLPDVLQTEEKNREEQESSEEREREERHTPPPLQINFAEYQQFLQKFYAITGKRPDLPRHQQLVEPEALPLFRAGYRVDDLERVVIATAWMMTPPTPRQVAELIGDVGETASATLAGSRPPRHSHSQFGDQKGDYSAFFTKSEVN